MKLVSCWVIGAVIGTFIGGILTLPYEPSNDAGLWVFALSIGIGVPLLAAYQLLWAGDACRR